MPTTKQTEQALTVHQVAAQLGMNYYTVLEYLNAGKIRGSKRGTGTGTRWRVRQEAVTRFLDEGEAAA